MDSGGSQTSLGVDRVKSQWKNPKDILSLLLLVGGDVIQKSLGQLASQPYLPVAFSFGWVAYAFSALMTVVGEHKLMPEPDCPAVVINTKTGYLRNNRSWILGRIVRDVDSWIDKTPKDALKALIRDAQWEEDDKVAKKNAQLKANEPLLHSERVLKKGLCVTIYRAIAVPAGGKSSPDLVWFWAYFVLIAQLGIAIAPCVKNNEWEVILITAAGNFLAFLTGALPQWRQEAWACRRLEPDNADKIVALTRGNGAQHVILVIGAQDAYNLEDLATSDPVPQKLTPIWLLGSLFLWISLLITVSGIGSDTWYLVGIGAIGMMQNIFVAAVPRSPQAFGLHLDYEAYCLTYKVMGSLMETEIKCARQYGIEGVGRSLIPTFFPSAMRNSEQQWWDLSIDDKETLFNDGFWMKKKEHEQMKMLDDLRRQMNPSAHGQP